MLDGWGQLGTLLADGPARARESDRPGLIAADTLRPRPRSWRALARPEQAAVADSRTPFTFFLAGRGAGKTWTASNTLAEWAMAEPGMYAVVAPTFGDCRALCVEGPSGLLRALGAPQGEPAGDLARYDKSKYELTLTNGSVIVMASDEAPGRLRGPNFTGAWCDEVGSWKRVKETFEEGVLFSTRIGSARKLLTGTPKRGHVLVREYHDRAMSGDPDVTLVRARTLDNASNLSPEFLRMIRAKYEGTTLGRQELDGLLLADAEGALITTALIDATRCTVRDVPDLLRVIVGVDPAVTHRPGSDSTGIVVVGLGGPPLSSYLGDTAVVPGYHLYVLADESMHASPRAWAERVLKVAEQWAADGITCEVNNGGDLVTNMVQLVAESQELPLPRLHPVHATVGKRTRAEPFAGVFEQRRVHIVDALPDVEDQLAGWVPGDLDSPDQLDATVWAAVENMPELAVGRATMVKVLN